ncbi:MAG: DUF4082 domain-containing protein [Ferruginibacter sp.]
MRLKFSAIIFAAACIITLLINCKKNDPPVNQYPAEEFGTSFLAVTGFDSTRSINNGADVETGIEFKPNVKGKITAFVFTIPNPNPALQITLWRKYPTPTVMQTYTVNASSAGNQSFQLSSGVELIKDSTYLLSMFTKDFYSHLNKSGASTTYPKIIGNLTILNFGYSSMIGQVAGQRYPNIFTNNFYLGDLFFNFQRID